MLWNELPVGIQCAPSLTCFSKRPTKLYFLFPLALLRCGMLTSSPLRPIVLVSVLAEVNSHLNTLRGFY